MAGDTNNADCQDRRNLVLAYVKSSKEQRAHYNQEEIKIAFWHIDWCWNNTCADLWRCIQNKNSDDNAYTALKDDPEFLSGLDQEISALLRWSRLHPSAFAVYGFASTNDLETQPNQRIQKKDGNLPN